MHFKKIMYSLDNVNKIPISNACDYEITLLIAFICSYLHYTFIKRSLFRQLSCNFMFVYHTHFTYAL